MVRVWMVSRGEVDPQIELFDAQGGAVGINRTFGQDTTLDVQLDSSGTYYVLLSDWEGNQTGGCVVTLQR